MHSALGFISPMEFEEKPANKEDAENTIITA
jgi:hypothetical protein